MRYHDNDVHVGDERDNVLAMLTSFRQHQHHGHRSPHKPLLMLLALGRLATTDSSAVLWSVAEHALADLIAEFGQPSKAGRAQSAAYSFTRLRSDDVWVLDADVPMDSVRPLSEGSVVGSLPSPLEAALRANPALIMDAARMLVTSNFPDTVAPDVLEAVGLDPHAVLSVEVTLDESRHIPARRRDSGWRSEVLQAWDRQCAFCGYDGQLLGASIGLDAAHVRWWAFVGPNTLDNGLALCACTTSSSTLESSVSTRTCEFWSPLPLTHARLPVAPSTAFTSSSSHLGLGHPRPR